MKNLEKIIYNDITLYLGLSVIMFYLILCTNFLGELFNSEIREILENNYYIKHLMGYIIIFTSIVLTDNSDNFLKDFKLSVIIYVLFVMSTKSNKKYFITILMCIFISYIFDLINTKYIKKKETKKIFSNLSRYLSFLGICIIIISFIKEFMKQKNKLKNKFSYLNFILYS